SMAPEGTRPSRSASRYAPVPGGTQPQCETTTRELLQLTLRSDPGAVDGFFTLPSWDAAAFARATVDARAADVARASGHPPGDGLSARVSRVHELPQVVDGRIRTTVVRRVVELRYARRRSAFRRLARANAVLHRTWPRLQHTAGFRDRSA